MNLGCVWGTPWSTLLGSNRKLRVLHLPTTVGGNPQAISRQMKAMGFHASSWALSEHPLGLGMEADHFIYREKESFLFKELKRFLCLKYVFLFQVVFFNFGSLLYSPFPSYRYNGERGLTYFRLFLYSKYRKMMHAVEIQLLKILKVKVFVQYQGSSMPYEELVELGKKLGNMSKNGTVRKMLSVTSLRRWIFAEFPLPDAYFLD